jgi:hypothetical protein
MSDKLKEFIDIPQQFIREGNQVCNSRPRQGVLLLTVEFIVRWQPS